MDRCSACLHDCVSHSCPVPTETRRRHWTPWNRSYKLLLAATRGLGIQSCVLDCWTISLTLHVAWVLVFLVFLSPGVGLISRHTFPSVAEWGRRTWVWILSLLFPLRAFGRVTDLLQFKWSFAAGLLGRLEMRWQAPHCLLEFLLLSFCNLSQMVITGCVSNLLLELELDVPSAFFVGTLDLKRWYSVSVKLNFSATYTRTLPVHPFSLHSSYGCESRLLAESQLWLYSTLRKWQDHRPEGTWSPEWPCTAGRPPCIACIILGGHTRNKHIPLTFKPLQFGSLLVVAPWPTYSDIWFVDITR